VVLALHRYYEFITDPTPNFRKLGFFAWLYMALAIVETLIVIKVRVCCSLGPSAAVPASAVGTNVMWEPKSWAGYPPAVLARIQCQSTAVVSVGSARCLLAEGHDVRPTCRSQLCIVHATDMQLLT